ncbi:MAG TPA: hypothetical protein VGC74_05210 [Stenotrophomonas sp.]|jgi:hypothetical protein
MKRADRATIASEAELDENICVHIFTASAAMLGVCMTVVGVLQVITRLQNFDTIADDLLSVDAMIYLVACLMAYAALRARHRGRNRALERIADVAFLLGLVISAIATGIITWGLVSV